MRTTLFALIALALSATISGCASWQQTPLEPPLDPSWSNATPAPTSDSDPPQNVIRYQSPPGYYEQPAGSLWDGYGNNSGNPYVAGSEYLRHPMATSGTVAIPATSPGSTVQPVQYGQPAPNTWPANPQTAPNVNGAQPYTPQPGQQGVLPAPSSQYGPPFTPGTGQTVAPPASGLWTQPAPGGPYSAGSPPPDLFTTPDPLGLPTPMADIIVNLQEAQTGRLMVGAAVNSDAGVTGQIVIDEKNFNWLRFPTSWNDWANGTAFRGAGQGFRLEAMPGTEVERYMFQFTEPYLLDTPVSFNLSAFLYTRNFFDWDEERLGGRIGFGYRIDPDTSISGRLRAEQVKISDPRVLGIPELDAALGESELYSIQVALVRDTRDIPFNPTQGYYFEANFEQVFGTFDYSRGEIDYRRYFLVTQRPDGSGRHVLGFSNRLGITGSQTPIYENFYAGGYATLRGFDFRGATPKVDDVAVGGELSLLGSVEYLFPITADDMLKGVVFCDYGTIEEEIKIDSSDYRVALGAGLRIQVPAMGPAPIALDFAVPLAREDTDDIRQFSFFMGFNR